MKCVKCAQNCPSTIAIVVGGRRRESTELRLQVDAWRTADDGPSARCSWQAGRQANRQAATCLQWQWLAASGGGPDRLEMRQIAAVVHGGELGWSRWRTKAGQAACRQGNERTKPRRPECLDRSLIALTHIVESQVRELAQLQQVLQLLLRHSRRLLQVRLLVREQVHHFQLPQRVAVCTRLSEAAEAVQLDIEQGQLLQQRKHKKKTGQIGAAPRNVSQ